MLVVAAPTANAQSVQLLGVNTDGALHQEDFLMKLLGLHSDVGGLLDQGIDVDFVVVVRPQVLKKNITMRVHNVSNIKSTGS